MLAGVVAIGKPFPRHGGFNTAIKKILQREQENPASIGSEMIDDFQVPGMPEHPGTPPAPISLSETAGLAAYGKPEWSAPKVNRSTAGLWGVVAIRSGPTVPM